MRFLLLLFIVIPLVEMWLLIKVGGLIGALPTVGLVALTAVIGVALLRRQGLDTLWRAQRRLDSGEVPATEILEGLFLAVGGALLLTPGFVTDTIGFLCLLRPFRRGLIQRMLARGVVQMRRQGFQSREGEPRSERHITIEGEYRRED